MLGRLTACFGACLKEAPAAGSSARSVSSCFNVETVHHPDELPSPDLCTLDSACGLKDAQHSSHASSLSLLNASARGFEQPWELPQEGVGKASVQENANTNLPCAGTPFPWPARLNVVQSCEKLFEGIAIGVDGSHQLQRGQDSCCLHGMWRGAQASIKVIRVGNPAPLARIGDALSSLSSASHPYLLQYYSCSICRIAPNAPSDSAAASQNSAAVGGPQPDLLLSFHTLGVGGGGTPSTGHSLALTACGGPATAAHSRSMESILGSAFECCLPLPDCGTLTGADAARLVLDALNPAPGDFMVALVSELCLLGDLTSALRSGVFGAACCAASPVVANAQAACVLPSAAAAGAAAEALAPARGCSGGTPTAGGRRGDGAAGACWTPARAVRAAVATAREAALGVVHLHASGSAHGNLRPSNVQLLEAQTDCRGFVAKVSDAGLGPRHTELGPELVAYIAPEALVWGVWAPSLADMQAADVYSFGVLLFEMLTGRRPSAQDLHALGCATAAAIGAADNGVANPVGAAAAAQHCWPEGWNPSVLPAQLLHLCGWCLQPDAGARPRMDLVANQLGHIEAHLRAAAAQAKQHAAACTTPPHVGGVPQLCARPDTFAKPAAGSSYGGVDKLTVQSAAGVAPAPIVAATLEPLSVLAAVSRLSPALPDSCGLTTEDGRELALPLLAACGRRGGLHNAESLDWSAIASEEWGS